MKEERIVSDPAILGGKPVVAGTRIPVYLILELLEADYDIEKVVKEYPSLCEEDVRAALHFASQLSRYEEVDLPRTGTE